MFTCAFNGPRDDYQLPLALHERGLLARLVTDGYAPRWLPLPGPLKRRRGPLPLRRVRVLPDLWIDNIRHKFLRTDSTTLFASVDNRLSCAALGEAIGLHSHLYLHSRYAAAAFGHPAAAGKLKGLFVFHPFEPHSRRLLQADMAAYPGAGWALENELEFIDGSRDADLEAEWRLADFITCASSFTKRSLVESGCPPAKVRVVPYGIDAARIAFDPAAKAGDPLRMLFVGQGVQRKGMHHLLRAWQAANLPGATLTCVCYRSDPGLMRSATGNVRVLPKLTRTKLHHEFTRAHVFILPSLIEGFGLVLLEALAHGCHTLSTPNTGLPDLPLSPGTGAVFPAGDPDALRAALETAAELHARGGIDHEGARRIALGRPWSAFRSEIATHALEQLHA